MTLNFNYEEKERNCKDEVSDKCFGGDWGLGKLSCRKTCGERVCAGVGAWGGVCSCSRGDGKY